MNLLLRMICPVLMGFVLDLILGDPRCLYHPVRMIGQLITILERIIRNCLPKSKWGERIGGAILAAACVGISVAAPILILAAAYRIQWWLGILAEGFMCYQILAVKSLKTESDKVYRALKEEGIEAGRNAVSMIVGRDTDSLDEVGVTKAAVETVAENTSDGVIAPLFYMMIGGAVLGFAYKAINTMDSMIGYKNEKYQYFGTAAARLDDAANYIPARLSAWLMIGAAGILGLDWRNAIRIYQRDRHNHKSPNAAQTESVMAGALDIRLAGNAWYFGKLYEKPSIGDAIRAVEPEDIRRSHKLLYGTAVLAAGAFLTVKIAILALLMTV